MCESLYAKIVTDVLIEIIRCGSLCNLLDVILDNNGLATIIVASVISVSVVLVSIAVIVTVGVVTVKRRR